jgi:hypothetical protein
MAASAEAQAASQAKFGPWKSNRLAMRPAMQLASSPGMESSVISGSRAAIRSWVSRARVSRTASGSAVKDGASASARAYSGKKTRSAVW